MSFSSEYIQDVPTEEILERFGSDPKSTRRQQLFYRDGEMFVQETGELDEHRQYPRQHSFIPEGTKGELLHSSEAWDNGILSFTCYTEEDGMDDEIHRIRSFRLSYHLTDDTFSLHEPRVDNSGMMQGRMFSHQRVPSVARVGGPYLHWRDLNIGKEVDLFGRRYRITSCDQFTRSFLEKRGIKLNPEENLPEDPWLVRRRDGRERRRNEADQQVSLERDFAPLPPVLSFRCCWLDSSNDFHGCRLKRIFRMTVFTADHTVSLTEETKEFEGQLFLRRVRLPMPASPDGVRRFYRSWDIYPGCWVEVFSRPMFIFECIGGETSRYMTQQHGETDYSNCSSEVLEHGPPPMTFDNVPKQLVFFTRMVDPPSMFYGVSFLLSYDVDRRLISVNEAGQRRKWSPGRSFLTNVDASTFSENQFCCGHIIQLFKWRFQLIEADKQTAEYLRWKGRQ